jgi:hypothetical protein
MESFCYWAKHKMVFELENREHKNVWIDEKEQIRYIGVFDGQDLMGRHFDDYIEVDEVRIDLYRRIKPKPRTNFDKITESVESLAEIMDNYSWCPYFSNSTCDREIECTECIKEWLREEADNV